MNDVMMQLGHGDDGFQFSVANAAYDSLRRSTTYRWEGQNRPRRLPVQQFVGPGADEIELTGTIFPHYKGGLGQIERMRNMAAKGRPLQLVAVKQVAGDLLGTWCIASIEETQTEFTAWGAPLKMQFTLSLIAYGDDRAVSNP